MNIIEARDLSYCYNGRPVLAIPDFEIPRASIIGLAGPNGSGKSTLLKLLSGVAGPGAGRVVFNGKGEMRHGVCLLPQECYLLRRSVYENIAYGLRIRGKTKGLGPAVADALKLAGLPSSFAKRGWRELSGGEAQRVALAARLALKPQCLLLDEPTAGVDMESARSIRRAVLLARNEWGTSLVIASHYRSWLNDICDRIVYLYNGRILQCSYENILTGPWEEAGDSLVSCLLSDGQRAYARKPAGAEQSAVISPDGLEINKSGHAHSARSFKGVISSMSLESHSEHPQVQVSCGDQRFVVNITTESLESDRLRPGQRVTLHYDPGAVVWL